MDAIVALSGGSDSFCAVHKAKEEGHNIVKAVFVDFGTGHAEREEQAFHKSCDLLGIDDRHIVRLSGLATYATDKTNILAYKFTLAVFLVSSVAKLDGIQAVVCGRHAEGGASPLSASFYKSLKEHLITDPFIQPGVVLLSYDVSIEEKLQIFQRYNISRESYHFETCNLKKPCGWCISCRKKQRELALLR